jgi:preprotein translocase subunit SecB
MAMQPEVKQYKLSPNEYQEILNGVNLSAVWLGDLNYSCGLAKENCPISLNFNTNSHIKEQTDGDTIVSFKFELKGLSDGVDVLSISGEYLLAFSAKQNITEDFFEIFRDHSLSIMIWPYLRELFYNLTSRSNIAPFVLPLIKTIPPPKA